MRFAKLWRRHAGAAARPGTLQPAPQRVEQATFRLMTYHPPDVSEQTYLTADEALRAADAVPAGQVAWLDMQGLHDVAPLEAVGEWLQLHPLAMEDILSLGQRPKAVAYDDKWFVVTRRIGSDDGRVSAEQVAMVLAERLLVTFHNLPFDPFASVRQRLEYPASRLRQRGADYLLYVLIDSLIDDFFPILEDLGEQEEALEQNLMTTGSFTELTEIRAVKNDLLLLRRVAWPTRELLADLERDQNGLITDRNRVFFRDAYQLSVEVMDLIEAYRELTAGLVELYLTSASSRTNEVVRVLTVISTIFLPLTFITGLYGMNFRPEVGRWNMPELSHPYGYPAALAVMLLISLGMLAAFRRRGWL